jgi:hypothetical protein
MSVTAHRLLEVVARVFEFHVSAIYMYGKDHGPAPSNGLTHLAPENLAPRF